MSGARRRLAPRGGHERIACVDLPAFPLQLLRREHPEQRGPLALVEADHPQALLLEIDHAAALRGVRAGMRYAAALQLCRDLRAAPLSSEALERARAELVEALTAFSPRVEPDRERPGVFWLDPAGLGSLFGPLERWAGEVHGALGARALEGAVVVGFARLPSWAIARTRRGVLVVESLDEETALAGRAPLAALALPEALTTALARLGVTTLEDFLALPRGEISVRFGPRARALHALFDDALRPPMHAVQPEAPVRVEAELETPDEDLGRLLFCIKGGLHAVMAELARRALALQALAIRLELEGGAAIEERIEPARATRDALSVLELARLRLSAVTLSARVERLALEAEPTRLDGTQLVLFAGRRHDPDAAARGIARLRASFGDAAVTRAALRDAWLPERAFAWEPTDAIAVPRAIAVRTEARLVRRVLPTPAALPKRSDGRPHTTPPIEAMTGPYRLQGGFWNGEVARDYFYAERADGALLWVYREGERWFLHGVLD